MNVNGMRCVIVASTGGSVLNELLNNQFFKANIFSVVSDRWCPAIEKADRHGVNTQVFFQKDKLKFCNALLEYLQTNAIDYIFSFYTKLFVGDLLEIYQDRIINLHPSLLPAFKGMDGFGDSIRYGVRYVGSTIHFIDENMDEGKIIIQTVYPLDVRQDIMYIRHQIFVQQCKSLLQVVKWLCEGRVHLDRSKVVVENASYSDFEFSPCLDFSEAVQLDIPFGHNQEKNREKLD